MFALGAKTKHLISEPLRGMLLHAALYAALFYIYMLQNLELG